MPLRIKTRIYHPCIRCGIMFPKQTKRKGACPNCKAKARKHGEALQKRMLEEAKKKGKRIQWLRGRASIRASWADNSTNKDIDLGGLAPLPTMGQIIGF